MLIKWAFVSICILPKMSRGKFLFLCFWESLIPTITGGGKLKKKNYKGGCEKRKLPKCEGVCKTYNAIQYA